MKYLKNLEEVDKILTDIDDSMSEDFASYVVNDNNNLVLEDFNFINPAAAKFVGIIYTPSTRLTYSNAELYLKHLNQMESEYARAYMFHKFNNRYKMTEISID